MTPPASFDLSGQQSAGVPVGGIGTGAIEFGQDARFRNITINNNRTAAGRIPVSPGSFLAVRAGVAREWSTRILQPSADAGFKKAGLDPTFTRSNELSWYGLYPASNYRLETDNFPLDVQWSALAPVIPYDTKASSLPLMMSVVQVSNPSEEMYSVSCMFNWENLRGCVADRFPDDRGDIRRITITDEDHALHRGTPNMSDVDAPPPVCTGLAFGLGAPHTDNAHGNYCLVAAPSDGSRVSFAVWDKNDSDDVRAIWTAFDERGNLPDTLSERPTAHCGAVNVQVNVSPRETRRILFLFSWYCPKFRTEAGDIGNAYALEYRDALDVATYGLRHASYFQRAVGNWQQRLLQSSLPNWYVRMLLNSCHVLSTNTLLSRDGHFAMMESPREAETGVLDRSFYSSFGTLLFCPGYAERELNQFAETDEEDEPGRLYRVLGRGTVGKPMHDPGPDEMLDLNAKFVLMAYRNFHLTGKTATLLELFPKLRQAMEYGLRHDTNGDGLPDVSGCGSTFTSWSAEGLECYVGGLWIAAMLAYSSLAGHLKHRREAEYFAKRAQFAARHFENRLWDDTAGYYIRSNSGAQGPKDDTGDDRSCHTGQLAGAWYLDFLAMPSPFSHERQVRAIRAIVERNGRERGVLLATDESGTPSANPDGTPADTDKAWISHTAALLAGPQLYHTDVDDALQTLKTIYQNVHARNRRAFSQPLMWDVNQNAPGGSHQDRHMGALSIWHSLYAIEGFWLSVPEQRIVVAPRLPKGVNHLAAPLFTPIAFGWLTFQLQEGNEYRQHVRITFDSPIFIKRIELAVPQDLTLPTVTLLINDDPAAHAAEVVAAQPSNRLVLSLQTPLQVQHPIEITVE